jgi:FkbM family methyltransferase
LIFLKKIIYKIHRIYIYNSYSFSQYLRIFFSIDQKIKIGKFFLTLPPYHLFSLYKKRYKKYDKFLVHLAKSLKKNDSLIDIGANVGDTLFQIIDKNNNFNYYCIEGDKFFSSYLKKNIEKLDTLKQKKIKIFEEIVGKNLKGNLVGNGGTKRYKYNSKGKKSKTLDEIVYQNRIKNIKLIKIDVDGYDYNIINSGLRIIKKNHPIIFFEMMLVGKFTIKDYINTINKLDKIGYKFWTLLDNYGNVVFRNKNTYFFLSYVKKFKLGALYDIASFKKKFNK